MKLVGFVLAWLYSNCIFLGCHCCPCVKKDVVDCEQLKEKPTEISTPGCCPICYIELGQNVTKTKCNHLFHKDCLDKWLERSSECPICKKNLKEIMGTGPCGTMKIKNGDILCPGYDDCNIVSISFKLEGVYNGPDNGELKNGKKYYKSATVYVPYNVFGLELLGYYIEGFKKRLLFSYGRCEVTREYGITLNPELFIFNAQPGFYDNEVFYNVLPVAAIAAAREVLGITLFQEDAVKIAQENIGKTIKVALGKKLW